MKKQKSYKKGGVQSAGFALFHGIGNCSYSGGTPTRIALAILGVQSAGFALFHLKIHDINKKKNVSMVSKSYRQETFFLVDFFNTNDTIKQGI